MSSSSSSSSSPPPAEVVTPPRRRLPSPTSENLSALLAGTEHTEVPSITITAAVADASPFSAGGRPSFSPNDLSAISSSSSSSTSPPASPFSPPPGAQPRHADRGRRGSGGARSPLSSPTSPTTTSPTGSGTTTPTRRASLSPTHRPYRTPAMGLEVLQVDLDGARVNPTYTVHREGECTLNVTPETRKEVKERPRAAELIKASKDLLKGFSTATLKLRCDFVHKETKKEERFFGTGVAVAPNLVLTVRHFLYHPDAAKRNDYTIREHIIARVDAENGTMAGLRVCRTHAELYKDPPLWFGTNLNWTDINKMPSDIDPMSSFRERSAEHWVWRDFVFLRITTPTDLVLPPPYFLPETDVFTEEPVVVGGFVVGETDTDHLLAKYENYVRVYQQATENKVHLPFFSSRTEVTWPEFVHTMFHRYPKRNIVISLGKVDGNSSQRLGLYNASTEKGMAGGAVSPVYEAVGQQHDVTLPLWGIHAGRFTDGLYNVFLSVEHPLFIVQYAYAMLSHFVSDPKYDVVETVGFRKRLWNYLNYFDWLDVYCDNLRREVYTALTQSQFEELASLPAPKTQTAVARRGKETTEEEDATPKRTKRKRENGVSNNNEEEEDEEAMILDASTLPSLDDMNVDQLKLELRRRRKKTSGTKNELLKRLEKSRNEHSSKGSRKSAKIVPSTEAKEM